MTKACLGFGRHFFASTRPLVPGYKACADAEECAKKILGSTVSSSQWVQHGVKTFYKKECQEKSSPSTGGREDFVSRSSPLHRQSASRFAREVLLLSCLPCP